MTLRANFILFLLPFILPLEDDPEPKMQVIPNYKMKRYVLVDVDNRISASVEMQRFWDPHKKEMRFYIGVVRKGTDIRVDKLSQLALSLEIDEKELTAKHSLPWELREDTENGILKWSSRDNLSLLYERRCAVYLTINGFKFFLPPLMAEVVLNPDGKNEIKKLPSFRDEFKDRIEPPDKRPQQRYRYRIIPIPKHKEGSKESYNFQLPRSYPDSGIIQIK